MRRTHSSRGCKSKQRSAHCLGANFATLRKRGDAVAGAERERHDGHSGLAAAGSYQATAIAKEKVLHVVRPMVRVDNRGFRIISHAACAEQVHAKLLLLRRVSPLFDSASCLVDFMASLKEPV